MLSPETSDTTHFICKTVLLLTCKLRIGETGVDRRQSDSDLRVI